MAKVSLSRQARLDLLSILEYLTDVAGARTARTYDSRLKQASDDLAVSPGIGSPRAHLGADTRLIIVNPYLIFYDGGPDSDVVHVLRILHGRRNITPDLVARGREP